MQRDVHGGSVANGDGVEGGDRNDAEAPPGVDRRRFLSRAATGAVVAGAAGWVTPVLLSQPAAAGPGTGLLGDFVAVGRTGNVVPASFVTTDAGATWPSSAQPYADGVLNGVATDGPAVVTVGIDHDGAPTSGVSRTSFDGGLTWSISAAPVPTNGDLKAVATNGTGTWVAVGSAGTRGATATSTDYGSTWSTPVTLPINNYLEAVAHGSGTWIAGGANAGTDTAIVVRSTNAGASWSTPAGIAAGVVRGLATNGAGHWVAVTSPWFTPSGGPSNVWVSVDDGVTWSGPTLTVSGDLYDIAIDSGSGTMVAVGHVGTRATAWRSTTGGVSWSGGVQLSTTASEAFGIAPGGGGLWVAVGYDRPGGFNLQPASFTSTDDGVTWPIATVLNTVGLLYGVVAT